MHRSAALFALSAMLALALPALADNDGPPPIPSKGDATIEFLGGWHVAPQHDFFSEQQRDGLNPSHNILQPGALVSLGFAADDDFHVTIDLGYDIDSYTLTGGTAQSQAFQLLLGADTSLYSNRYLTLYVGGGLGYSLNTFTYGGTSIESNSSAGFLKAGLRLRLTNRVAFVLEDRYVISAALWPELNSSFTVGGNMLSVGFMLHFFSPEDPGHPQAPTSNH